MKSVISRRKMLQTLTVGSVLGIAGCSENGSQDTGGTETNDNGQDETADDSPTPPDVSFELEYTDIDEEGAAASVTVRHTGGEPITADNTGQLVLWGEQMSDTIFSSVNDDAGAEPIEPGYESTHTLDDNTATLFWSPPGKTTREADSVTVAETSVDADI